MASAKTFLKIITVTSSATLMAGFVAFKAGAFDSYMGGPNANSELISPPDSLKKDTVEVADPGISSSKFMIISEPETLKKADMDTTNDPIDDDLIIPSSKSGEIFDIKDFHMESSKSGRIFTPKDTVLLAPKDTLSDSLRATKSNPNSKFNKK